MTGMDDTRWPAIAAEELYTETPDRCPGFAVRRDVGALMRDGVRLSANVFLPDGGSDEGPWPSVLIRQPYGKDFTGSMWARGKYWARRGYACVVQDVRGTYGSEGEWEPFTHEAADGWDTLDWVARQPWCDGAIGMSGESYHGYTQWAVAASGHPHLRCISPGDSSPDPYRMAFSGGAFSLAIGLWACMMLGGETASADGWDPWRLPLVELDAAMGRSSAPLQLMLAHPSRDQFWDRVDMTPSLPAVRIPVLHWGGWYDVILQGTLLGWEACAPARAGGGQRADQRLIIGPTDHARLPAVYGASGTAGEDAPGAWRYDHTLRFFDRHLRGDGHALDDEAPVKLFVMGAERWRSAAAWPPPEAEAVTYYLHGGAANSAFGDGRLATEPAGDEQGDTFAYDPERPVDVWLAAGAWELTWAPKDRGAVERRADVLVYTSDELADDLEVTGPVSATLFAASSAPDTDFTAALVDVFPDGYAHHVQEGIVRARYRRSERAPELLRPGVVEEYTIDLLATSHLFRRGHRLRLEVSSSNFGRFDRNLNGGGEFARETVATISRQTVHHSRAYPSHIILPVIPGGSGA